jgi:hypothetical protein
MKGGENEMNQYANYQLRLVKERRNEEMKQAENARRFARPSKPLRRSVGQSIVRFGERLAGEQPLELARFR